MQSNFDLNFDYKPPEELIGNIVKGHAGKPPGQGPYIAIYLVVGKDTIEDATFQTYGCPACIACSQAICQMVKGLHCFQIKEIRQEHLLERVGPLPREKRHCASLAIEALKDALQKFL
ncbi:MAG: iron-sulfur cluster assembly scaffold protein [Candidatus Brocadiae bacterium]|nr:iron-sulfur cluster assembly scaffold protein [Candidatus Brocadiia bacterium]